MTKPLRQRHRSLPRDFSPSLVNLSGLAQEGHGLGRCRIEYFQDGQDGPLQPTYGESHPIMVVDQPREEAPTPSIWLEFHKALIELSERACPTDNLGDEALGLCYNPSAEAKWLVKDFVTTFGLLKWDQYADCDCIGWRDKICTLSRPYGLERCIEDLKSVEREMADLDSFAMRQDKGVPDQPSLGGSGQASPPGGVGTSDAAENAGLDFGFELPDLPSTLGPSTLANPFRARFQPPSPAEQRAWLTEQKAKLEKQLLEETEKAKRPPDDDEAGNGRFFSLLWDFVHSHPDVEHANAVAWILQEALQLRRAARIWDALRRYRLGASSDIVRGLWTKKRDGHLWLFDIERCPWPRPAHRYLVFLTEMLLQELINGHVWDVRAWADQSYFPAGASLRETDFRRGKTRLRLRPRTPLAAAWLLFFDDVLNDRASGRICQECAEVFEPRRTDQVFCSTRCSNRFHQREWRAQNRTSKKGARR